MIQNIKFSFKELFVVLLLSSTVCLSVIGENSIKIGEETDLPTEISIHSSRTGVSSRSQAITDEWMFVIDYNDKLHVYALIELYTPIKRWDFDIPSANEVFVHNGYLYISDSIDKLYVYDISIFDSEPIQFTPVFTYVATGRVRDIVFSGSNAFLLPRQTGDQVFTNSLEILDVSNPANVTQTATLPLSGNGVDITYDPSTNRVYCATRAQGNIYSIDIIDVSDVNSPQRIANVPSNFEIQRMYAEADRLIMAGNDNANNDFHMVAYNLSNPELPLQIQSVHVSESSSWDMIFMDNVFLTSVPGENSVYTHVYKQETNEFLAGPVLQSEQFMWNLSGQIDPTTQTQPKSRNSSLIQGDYYRYFLYLSNEVYGFQVGIMKKNKLQAQQVNLRVMIEPSEAADNGCSTVPVPGDHPFDINTEMNVHAVPNPSAGWYFNKWTGDVSGSNLSAHLLLDRDKLAVANFAEVLLTVSGGKEKRIFCPSEINEDNNKLMLPITFCASEIDGWTVTQIKLKTHGAGNEVNDLMFVSVKSGANTLYSGFAGIDNQIVEATLEPPISIGPGECVSVTVNYHFDFLDPNSYGSDEPKSFLVETDGVVAKPDNFEEGKIAGKAKSDTLYVARVYNNRDAVFATIQESISSAKTLSGDSCIVCPGIYDESVGHYDSTKSFTLFGKEGKRYTTIRSIDELKPSLAIGGKSKDITVTGFTLQPSTLLKTSTENRTTDIAQEGLSVGWFAKNTTIKDIKIESFELGLSISGRSSYGMFDNIEFGNCSQGIVIGRSHNNTIRNNSFSGLLDEEPSISLLYKSHNNKIENNTSDGKFSIKVIGSNGNRIINNQAATISLKSYIQFEKDCDSNLVALNKKMEIRLVGDGTGNKIVDNTTRLISANPKIHGMKDLHIKNNTINNYKFKGIDIDATFGRVTGLKIIDNTIKFAKTGGIYVKDAKDFIIRDNTVSNNGFSSEENTYSGVYLNDCENGKIEDNYIYKNGKHGLEIEHSKNINITDNRITKHENTKFTLFEGIGIKLKNVKKAYIGSNKLLANCDDMLIDDSEYVRVGLNVVSETFCIYSGIHIKDSDPIIEYNNITNNNGNGIVIEGNSNPVIFGNNIYGNGSYGINNETGNNTVLADGNFWGESGQPGDNHIIGDVIANNWRESEASFVGDFDSDSIVVYPGLIDSVSYFIRDLSGSEHNYRLQIDDPLNWYTGAAEQFGSSTDSTSSIFTIPFEVPGDIAGTEMNEISVNAYLTTNDSLLFTSTLRLATYTPVPERIVIQPDSVSIEMGDTLQLTYTSYDQMDNTIVTPLQWIASKGSIDNNGIFIADSSAGAVKITAQLQGGSLTSAATLFISEILPALSRIKIEPDSVFVYPGESIQFEALGFDQNGMNFELNPEWECDGGIINIYGLFLADSTSGEFTVTVYDTVTGISANGYVTILPVVSVDNKNRIPANFILNQNYPNPFNPETKISFGIPYSGKVKIEIFNILGQRIEVLKDGYMQAGFSTITWNPESLASGVYILVMNAKNGNKNRNGFIAHKKMIYLK